MKTVLMLSVWLVLSCAAAQAQWVNYPEPGTPRMRDGKPNLNAAAPRAPDGKPDLTGVWFHEITTPAEMKRLYGAVIDEAIKVGVPGMEIGTQHKYSRNIFVDWKPEDVPMRPKAAELLRRRAAEADPSNVCSEVQGFPRAGLLSEPMKIVQAPRLTMILYEVGNLHRQIFVDGRKLPVEFALPAYMGYSVGHWEKNTFVIDTAGFNDKTVLDGMGHPHSESLHVVERFHRRDFGHLDYEITFDDPEMYTKAFAIKIPHTLVPDNDIFEMFCSENEKDREHLKRK